MEKLNTDLYIGIPFTTADCYQFGSILYNAYFGYPLPSLEYELKSAASMLSAADGSIKSTFTDIDRKDIEYLDGIVFKSVECARHVGYYLGDGLFIHQNINSYPSIEKLNSIKWKDKILGIYRYEP